MRTLLHDFLQCFGRAAAFSNQADNLGDALRAFDAEGLGGIGLQCEPASAERANEHDGRKPRPPKATLAAAN